MSPDLCYLDYPTSKGSLGPAFAAKTCTERPGQASFWPYPLREVSDLSELTFVHLRYRLTDVPPSQTPPLIASQIGLMHQHTNRIHTSHPMRMSHYLSHPHRIECSHEHTCM